MKTDNTPKSLLGRVRHVPLLMYGVLLVFFGFAMYLTGVLMGPPRLPCWGIESLSAALRRMDRLV